MPNPTVLNQLATAERVTEIYAQLLDLSDQVVYQFLYNPEEIQWNRKANYAAAPASATSTPSQQYLYTEGRTYRFQGLLLQSYCEGKSLRSLLEGLQALMVVDPQGNSFAPKQVSFVWGSYRVGPCVITDLQVTESAWLGGETAEARVDLTLIELPPPDTNATETATPTVATPAAAQTITLSDRQREDTRKAAEQWLAANLNNLTPQVRDIVRARRFRYLTSADGTVKITDSSGTEIGTVGVYNGQTFDASKGTLTSATTTQRT